LSAYSDEVAKAMTFLGEDPRTIFLGQAIKFPGTAMTSTVASVPEDRKIELPVAEEMQMGFSIGLALHGFIPVTIFPRWNFLLLAANQLVNHLDKLPLMGGYRPKVIIRVGVGAEKPLHPGPQHVGDFGPAFRSMLETIRVVELRQVEDIVPSYQEALEQTLGSTLLIEMMDAYA
jgi:pyruvate/2-oxoglutarate/acetoin dehydrogenase E1 component